jgi:aspartate racemase
MIGIVGGLGPMAGIDLFRKITELTPAKSDQEHLPVILFSFPSRIKDRTEYLEGKIKENPGIEIAEICLELSKAGATVAGIPCNTAHSPEIFNCISEGLKKQDCTLKIVHMIDETIELIGRTIPKKSAIGVLSTTGTYKQKIYFNKLKESGYIPIVPNEHIQSELVHNSVYHPEYGIKTQSGKITEKARSQLYHVMDIMKEQGVKAVILGCSEIPMALSGDDYKGMLLIDPTRILAGALIAKYNTLSVQKNSNKSL